ncbi:4-methylaminobutanoate oxidase (formaldehyde-forming) [Candidatus Planktophila vernalis]|uniref:4-methylaminobutanoate oxidase (Formaldehyde-forming) n=1 Tax=Candidatus Planktophila vernalis TaxID=1884907 RepID=A0A249KUW1_9ACTN|nr:FAD-dependent oxidoreductase [Candidatus Planktophila vernalis]ASY20547.1 4-methylaminobutanoate oxidase (formaldehyde-forming) [Candidatus Planktophila vernalis]
MAVSVVPTRAKIIIIGGGVGGTSVAYHLAELGEKDVILLDRNELTSGSTFHSAGLVGQLRADPTLTLMNMHSVDLYRKLQQTETPPSWRECGSIKLASTPERMQEIRRQIGWAKTFGLELKEISPKEAQDLFPLIDLEGVVGACYMASDGQVDPSQLAMALAAGARRQGVQIFTHTRVLEIKTTNGRVSSVVTDKGEIECEIVVNCGGMYAPQIARMVNVRVPIVPMSHQYLITENFMPQDAPFLPSLRDPDNLIYFRQEVSGLLMGGYERTSKAWSADYNNIDDIPANFNNSLLAEDWDRFTDIAEASQKRVPKMAEVGIKSFINGPEGFTPDNEFCLGETSVGGFFVAAGFCAHGIAGAGGIGKVVAEWVVAGEPTMDLWHMDIKRFGASYESPDFTLQRITENYEQYYDIHYPSEERKSARPKFMSPVYEWHKANGAVFGEKSSWERVNFYATNIGNDALRPKDWLGNHWSSAVQVEHYATRNNAGLFDESSFAKARISGARAGEFLNYVCANNVVKGVGKTTYTQALNSKAGIESDYTVTQTAENEFMIVTGTAFSVHDFGWLEKMRREHSFDGVEITNITKELACFGIMGPKSRAILQSLTSTDLSHAAFPFMSSQEITVGDIKVRATRLTYVGELGWELYVPTEQGLELWEKIMAAGKAQGIKACGYRAIESLRLEKGYRAWAGEINTETNPYEAGLGFAVSLKKEKFHGKEAAIAAQSNLSRKLVAITFDDMTCVPFGSEPIRIGSKIVGRIKSGGQGYTIKKAIAYAYLPIEHTGVGTSVDVEFFGNWRTGVICAEPLFDPANERIRC